MCKHKHTTVVLDWLEDGTPLPMHQCDMCGKIVAQKPVEEEVDNPPPLDMVALNKAFDRLIDQILKEA